MKPKDIENILINMKLNELNLKRHALEELEAPKLVINALKNCDEPNEELIELLSRKEEK